ncbi:MAG TPA: hypothetical protein VFB65_23905 [Pyrinomonadaceae bacterium]|nr:hypothetical protein [Pyrinomonadaceae bacterium]
MTKLIRKLLVVVMMGALSTGAFAQGKGKDKRPPKEPVKVIDGKGGRDNRPSQPPPKPPKEDRGKKRP